jgi:hypothetical protein
MRFAFSTFDGTFNKTIPPRTTPRIRQKLSSLTFEGLVGATEAARGLGRLAVSTRSKGITCKGEPTEVDPASLCEADATGFFEGDPAGLRDEKAVCFCERDPPESRTSVRKQSL